MEQFLDGPEVDVDVTCFARGRMDEGVEGDADMPYLSWLGPFIVRFKF